MRRADRHHPLLGKPHQITKRRGIGHGIRRHRPADIDQRPLGGLNHRRQPIQILRPRTPMHLWSRQVDRSLSGFVEQILRQDHRHRPRQPALRHMKRPRNRLARRLRLIHLDHQFRHIRQQPRIILLLQRHPPEILTLHLPHQQHQRRRVMKRAVHRHHRIGQPRPARHHRHPGPIAQPPIRHRHERRPALMPAHHQLNGILVRKGVGQPEITLPRHAIDDVNVMRFQAIGEQTRYSASHGLTSPGSLSADCASPAAMRQPLPHGKAAIKMNKNFTVLFFKKEQ